MYYEINSKNFEVLVEEILTTKEAPKPLLVLGTSGIGKTYTITKLAQSYGNPEEIREHIKEMLEDQSEPMEYLEFAENKKDEIPFVVADWRLADIVKEDMVGFPRIDEESRTVEYFPIDFVSKVFMRPAEVEISYTTDQIETVLNTRFSIEEKAQKIMDTLSYYLGKIVLFFDEINRMDPGMMQVIMELLGSRTMHQVPLKPDVKVMGAMNPMESDLYMTTTLNDIAFLRRWQRVIVTPDYEGWLGFMEKADIKVPKSIEKFLEKNPDLLIREEDGQAPLNPALWTEACKIINEIDLLDLGRLQLRLGALFGDNELVDKILRPVTLDAIDLRRPENQQLMVELKHNPNLKRIYANIIPLNWVIDTVEDVSKPADLLMLALMIHENNSAALTAKVDTYRVNIIQLYNDLPANVKSVLAESLVRVGITPSDNNEEIPAEEEIEDII